MIGARPLKSSHARQYLVLKVENVDAFKKNLYLTDEYINKNPSLHERDSPWKVSKIIPLVDRFIDYINQDEIALLDVGGGAGLILKAVSSYIRESYGIKVDKFALDLSPGMLEIQKKQNPDLKKALNEDICKTSLRNKAIDLTLMIDLIEHVPNPTKALEEVKRISNFVIFKVPLEDNLVLRTWNFVARGRPRQFLRKTVGHIIAYSFGNLRRQIEKHAGQMLDFYFTNVHEYFLNSEHYKNELSLKNKIKDSIATYVFRLSPNLCSLIFDDFVMILVKCY